jgi:hypothetical protein
MAEALDMLKTTTSGVRDAQLENDGVLTTLKATVPGVEANLTKVGSNVLSWVGAGAC